MKKTLAFAAIAVLLISLALSAEAAGKICTDPDISVSMEFPDGWLVLSRNMSSSDPALSSLGLTKSDVVPFLTASNIYIDGLNTGTNEEVVLVYTEGYLINDLSSFPDELIDGMIDELIPSIAGLGIRETESGIYRHNGIKYVYVCGEAQDNSLIEYFTFHDGGCYNFTMHTYTSTVSALQKETMRRIVDSVEFSGAVRSNTMTSDREKYTDPESGISFLLPFGWHKDEFSKSKQYLDTKFVSPDGKGMIMSGTVDFFDSIPASQAAFIRRSDINMSLFSEEDLRNIAAPGVSVKETSRETINNIQFVRMVSEMTGDVLGFNVTTHMIQYMTVNNGYAFIIECPCDEDSEYYNDFMSVVRTVRLP